MRVRIFQENLTFFHFTNRFSILSLCQKHLRHAHTHKKHLRPRRKVASLQKGAKRLFFGAKRLIFGAKRLIFGAKRLFWDGWTDGTGRRLDGGQGH